MSSTTITAWTESIWTVLPQITMLLKFVTAAASFYVSCPPAHRRLRQRSRTTGEATDVGEDTQQRGPEGS